MTFPKTYYNAPKQPSDWPNYISITIIILLVLVGGYIVVRYFFLPIDRDLNNIAVGEPNQNVGWRCDNTGCCMDDYCYSCDQDLYNCDDFSTQSQAQELFDTCFKEKGDVHQLDLDNDGKVCESLA